MGTRSAVATAVPGPTVSAGTYVRLRREAAGVSLPEAAKGYAHHALGALATELLLSEVERDLLQLGEPSLRRLARVFRFDVDVYLDLADGGVETPSICMGCGCTWNDACPGGCAWADASEELCTTCAGKIEA